MCKTSCPAVSWRKVNESGDNEKKKKREEEKEKKTQ